jgi:formate dehydrogenase subunit delta
VNIDLLIKMTNEISAFFAGTADAEQAARDVASHLRRFWAPRMRAQLIAYYRERDGAGLSDLAKSAVGLLAAAPAAAPATTAPAPGSKA